MPKADNVNYSEILSDFNRHGKEQYPNRQKLYLVGEKYSNKTADENSDKHISPVWSDKSVMHKQSDKDDKQKQNKCRNTVNDPRFAI
jgi:hypothetical protein